MRHCAHKLTGDRADRNARIASSSAEIGDGAIPD